jgi:hypothetical protein
MKKPRIISICFIILGLFPCHVHGGEKEHLELAFKIVEKTHMSKMFVDLSESFMETYFESSETYGEQDPAKTNNLRQIFRDEVNSGEDELKWMLAEIYADQFTENELRAILVFFNSPAGIAWLDKKLFIQTESEQVGLEWGRLLTQRVLKKFKTRYEKND